MANVDIRVGKKDAVFFSANPTLILKDGQFLFNSDTLELFIGDGTSQLSALVAINVPPSSGVQSVTGPNVDNTDPNNPIVNVSTLQEVVTKSNVLNGVLAQTADGLNYILVDNGQVLLRAGDGVTNSIIDVQTGSINLQAASVQKNGVEIATLSDIPILTGYEQTVNKDATGGYAGLTAFKINFKNALNTFTSFFTNSNSSARTYTFKDRDGIIADDTDLASKHNVYPILIRCSTFNPADNATYYTSSFDAAPLTVPANRQFQFAYSGTLDAFNFLLSQTINGSGETVTINLRNITDGISTQIMTFTSNFGTSTVKVLKATSLGISVDASKNYSLEINCPAWTTNPSGWTGAGMLYAY